MLRVNVALLAVLLAATGVSAWTAPAASHADDDAAAGFVSDNGKCCLYGYLRYNVDSVTTDPDERARQVSLLVHVDFKDPDRNYAASVLGKPQGHEIKEMVYNSGIGKHGMFFMVYADDSCYITRQGSAPSNCLPDDATMQPSEVSYGGQLHTYRWSWVEKASNAREYRVARTMTRTCLAVSELISPMQTPVDTGTTMAVYSNYHSESHGHPVFDPPKQCADAWGAFTAAQAAGRDEDDALFSLSDETSQQADHLLRIAGL